LVRRVYRHVRAVRHRTATVEYRVKQHAAILRERLATGLFRRLFSRSATS
jgi:23S rRNA G2445 N2-methylase RlmL